MHVFIAGSYHTSIHNDVCIAAVPIFCNTSRQVRILSMILLIRDRLIEVHLTPDNWDPG